MTNGTGSKNKSECLLCAKRTREEFASLLRRETMEITRMLKELDSRVHEESKVIRYEVFEKIDEINRSLEIIAREIYRQGQN